MNNRFSNVRCHICNRVSHSEIATEDHDHFTGRFYSDTQGIGWECAECRYVTDDLRYEYGDDDFFDEDEEVYDLDE